MDAFTALAFGFCAASTLQYSTAWAAAINAVMAFNREVRSRCLSPK